MHQDILPRVIFSPGQLAIELVEGLSELGVSATLFSAGPVETKVQNVTADLSGFETELEVRNDTYLSLLKKHPLVFISLARQAQSEIIARAFEAANNDELDIVHIYTNEEDIALPFSKFCQKPVVFTHHDPFNFMVKYKHVFPKYASLNWVSLSSAQRKGMPLVTNWVANIPHGVGARDFMPIDQPESGYFAYLGRIVEPKGLHLAISAIKEFNESSDSRTVLRFAGKHYSDGMDSYWRRIEREIDDKTVINDGYIGDRLKLSSWLGNARALIVPSVFDEPFGMVMIEALACGTPIIGLDSGAIPEVIRDGETGFIVRKHFKHALDRRSGKSRQVVDEELTASALVQAMLRTADIDRKKCRRDFEERFTAQRMCQEHKALYERLTRE